MKPKVFLTRELPPQVMEFLQAHTDLTYNQEDRILTKSEIMEGVKGQDGLLCLLTDPIDQEIIDVNPELKVITNYAVGHNNIDVEAASRRRLPVTNTPGVLTQTSADMAFGLLLAIARNVVRGDRLVRSGGWEGWGPQLLLGKEVNGATLGLLGLGRIGKAMVRRAKGFDMEVVYWNRTRLPSGSESQFGVKYLPLEELLAEADFVSLHMAYADDTHHLIGEKELKAMKNDGYLINTSRGAVVDEKALLKALKEGWIGGAALDVYEHEPAIEPGLAELENVILLPHLASATLQTRTQMGMIAAEDCLAVCQGKKPKNLVNTDLLEMGIFE